MTPSSVPIASARDALSRLRREARCGGFEDMTSNKSGKIPFRVQVAIYATGIFSNSANIIVAVIVPLWMLSIDASPFMVGLALGGRYFLPSLLSIHGGVLMDRIGTRRVLFFFSIVGIVLAPLHPVLPFAWVVVLLQMFLGLVATMGWVAGQTLIGQLMPGSHGEAGLLGFSARSGSLVAAPIAGFVWDVAGPWGGFGLMALWGVGLLVGALFMPRSSAGDGAKGLSFSDVLPRYSDYRDAFVLLAAPGLAIVVIVSMLNLASGAVQTSFFVVYLEQIGMSGTLIGTVMSASSLMAALGNLAVGPFARRMNVYWLLFVTVVLSMITTMVTPLLKVYFFLLGASAIRGTCQGLSQPLMISAASEVTDAGSQGKSVGLRITANRIALTVIPIVMGAVVEWVGLEDSFYVVGAAMLTLMGLVGIYMARAPQHFRKEP